MPLMPIYYNTTNLNPRMPKKNKKRTLANLEHEEWLKSRGLHSSQLKETKKNGYDYELGVRHSEPYNTNHNITGNTNKPESKVYTGTLIKGIATMHKSNAVPVIDEKQMIEISKMRRG